MKWTKFAIFGLSDRPSDGFIQKSNLKLELNIMILKELERQKKTQK